MLCKITIKTVHVFIYAEYSQLTYVLFREYHFIATKYPYKSHTVDRENFGVKKSP